MLHVCKSVQKGSPKASGSKSCRRGNIMIKEASEKIYYKIAFIWVKTLSKIYCKIIYKVVCVQNELDFF